MTVTWDHVNRADVLHAIQQYDSLRPDEFFSAHSVALCCRGTAAEVMTSWLRPA